MRRLLQAGAAVAWAAVLAGGAGYWWFDQHILAELPSDLSQDPEDRPAPTAAGAGAAAAAAREEPIGRGDLVKHGRYGVGTVVGLEGSGAKAKLTVYFAGKGRVKLVAAHARLQRMS